MAKKDILIEEELELSSRTGAAAPLTLPPKVISIFPALAHRNFQLYVFGLSISLVGFWLHQVAIGWLVFQLTHSAFWVGTTAAIGGLPFLFFTTFAGVYIDKLNKQKLLVVTQVAEAAIAFTLGILVLTNIASLPAILLLVFANGIIGSIDLPARLTFIVEMVGKRDLPSAIPINNSLFNAARFVGPAIAGGLIAAYGAAWPFILNGVSFLAGIWAIMLIKPVFRHEPDIDTHPLQSLKDGLKFSFTTPKIFYFTLLAFFTAVFIWPFQTLMPPIAQNVFSSGANGLGTLLSSAGAGSLAGAIFTSANSRRENKIPFILAGLIISSLGLILFSLNRNFALAHLFLFVSGFGTLMMVSTLNSLVQLNSPDQMRARVMAVYLTMFVGMMPLGNQLAGIVASRTSAIFTVGLGGVLMLFAGTFLFLRGVFANLSKNN